MPVAWDSLVPKSVVDFHIYPDFLMRAAMTRVEGGIFNSREEQQR